MVYGCKWNSFSWRRPEKTIFPNWVDNSRQLDVHASGRVLSVVEGGVVVQLEAGLHAVVVVKLNECKAAALLRIFLLSGDADCGRGVLFEVLGQGLVVGGVGKVACTCGDSLVNPVSSVRRSPSALESLTDKADEAGTLLGLLSLGGFSGRLFLGLSRRLGLLLLFLLGLLPVLLLLLVGLHPLGRSHVNIHSVLGGSSRLGVGLLDLLGLALLLLVRLLLLVGLLLLLLLVLLLLLLGLVLLFLLLLHLFLCLGSSFGGSDNIGLLLQLALFLLFLLVFLVLLLLLHLLALGLDHLILHEFALVTHCGVVWGKC